MTLGPVFFKEFALVLNDAKTVGQMSNHQMTILKKISDWDVLLTNYFGCQCLFAVFDFIKKTLICPNWWNAKNTSSNLETSRACTI